VSRVKPLGDDELGDLADVLEAGARILGFVPNSQLIMAYKPEVLRAFAQLANAIYHPANSLLPVSLKTMISAASSLAAGCMYCAAHTSSTAGRVGVDEEKIAAIWEFETSELFSEAERSALRFAQSASSVPNLVTDADFDDLRTYFGEEEIVEIVSVISLFGFLNRWNDTLATDLEADPVAFANRALKDTAWDGAKHGAG
jgi:uncharacterized peroxidase-related enzyme